MVHKNNFFEDSKEEYVKKFYEKIDYEKLDTNQRYNLFKDYIENYFKIL